MKAELVFVNNIMMVMLVLVIHYPSSLFLALFCNRLNIPF